MPRNDLLAMTPDDLAALTNRGTVKRAVREIEEREVSAEITEDTDGTVHAKWSDNVICKLPGGKTVRDATCSCIATVLCRHVMRTILAYQTMQRATDAAAGASGASPAKVAEPWNPGAIPDAALDAIFKKTVLAAARTRFAQGLLVELVRSAKPTARFHQMACTLRFIVPGDLRYTHCDCAENPPCSHVPLAVWAFRMLDAEKSAGLVATQKISFPVPEQLLDAGESLMRELAADGISGISPGWKDRTLRLAEQCEVEQLIWPGQVLADLVEQMERYARHDASFSPEHAASLVGEWLIRSDAIRSQTNAAPQLLIRGSKSDRKMEISGGRFIGLGCDVRLERASVDITAYLQDADSGTVIGIGRTFVDPPKDSPDPPREFYKLADTPAAAHASFASVGAGQMITHGGKRSPDHRLTIGRTKASVSPQSFAWESLHAPVLTEDFQELRARYGILPPAALRPRLIAENLHVCPISRVVEVRFNEMLQAVEAIVEDARQERAQLLHPYSDRGRQGAEALLAALGDPSLRLKYISGHGRVRGGTENTGTAGIGNVVIFPVMLVFEGPGGRTAVQPWIDRLRGPQAENLPAACAPTTSRDIAAEFPTELHKHTAELLLLGLRRADARVANLWQELTRQGEALGFSRLIRPVRLTAASLAQKSAMPRWAADGAAVSLLELTALTKLAQDIG